MCVAPGKYFRYAWLSFIYLLNSGICILLVILSERIKIFLPFFAMSEHRFAFLYCIISFSGTWLTNTLLIFFRTMLFLSTVLSCLPLIFVELVTEFVHGSSSVRSTSHLFLQVIIELCQLSSSLSCRLILSLLFVTCSRCIELDVKITSIVSGELIVFRIFDASLT